MQMWIDIIRNIIGCHKYSIVLLDCNSLGCDYRQSILFVVKIRSYAPLIPFDFALFNNFLQVETFHPGRRLIGIHKGLKGN